MRTVILVPRRAHLERDKLWAWARARWEAHFPELAIYEGHHEDGPFNRSMAVNRASRRADLDGRWDLAVVIDADIFIRRSQLLAALETAERTGRVTWAHRRWRGLHRDWTTRILNDRRDFGPEVDREDMDILVERTNPISWSCCVVFPRAVWDSMGGFDERFRGWGFEDMAIQSLVVGLYGHERIEGDVYHLWHDRSTPGDGRAAKHAGAYTAEAITNARLGRRYMVALRRDHGLHDRPGLPATDEERERDIANLLRDDAALASDARRLDLPDWSDWWPTLEELRDGAKLAGRAVTVVMHSGGTPERWPERRGYLLQAIASLTEMVEGPIVQRVVYDCWGDAAITAELEDLVRPFGFYVVGPGRRVDFTAGMQAMWGYLRKRAKGEFILQVEDDFTYERPVDLGAMIDILQANEHLVQLALLRDACYQDERDTGGILGWPLPAFTFREGWFEHRQFFTLNPSLFRRSLTDHPWPAGHHSETLFGRSVLNDKRAASGFLGDGTEWIRHIGETRAGAGY